MNPETCTRVRDAAAIGPVLGDAELEGHAKGCEACASYLVEHRKRRDFRDAFPVLMSLADEGERARQPRLTAFARKIPPRRLLLMIAALVSVVGFLTRKGAVGDGAVVQGNAISGPPNFRIYNLEDALFESKAEGETVRCSITRGVAAIFVQHLNGGQRFLLTLPDGDLEARSMRFVVGVENGKTQTVEVNEGTVELRLEGREKRVLAEGQRFTLHGSTRPTLSFVSPPPRGDAGAAGAASANR